MLTGGDEATEAGRLLEELALLLEAVVLALLLPLLVTRETGQRQDGALMEAEGERPRGGQEEEQGRKHARELGGGMPGHGRSNAAAFLGMLPVLLGSCGHGSGSGSRSGSLAARGEAKLIGREARRDWGWGRGGERA